MLSYWNDYPTIQNKLQIVCSLIEEQLQVRNKEIQDTLIEFANSGGNIYDLLIFSFLLN
ncbi:hypothetical protein GCM10025857_47880 [Alicyclobacillus contaminans]|uniref:Uncharacterized protein n=1 Tax=Tetragenococcus osmophilus TaxID=526944 RepID=A0AA37XMY1_9ENTE|nr:hypothetical protein GCM10025857_47880 [Alicyclobacillus contaminans]GMA72619.1 hypothetical protein GCM10025885_16680 [Tetragenococcus osmophilus]